MRKAGVDPQQKFIFLTCPSEDAMSGTKTAVVFQQSPSSKSLLDVKEIPANESRN